MKQTSSSNGDVDVIKILQEMGSHKAAYPHEMLSARRAEFLSQIEERTQTESEYELAPKDGKVVGLLQALQTVDSVYPAGLWSARRSAFRQHIAQVRQDVSFWNRLRTAFQSRIPRRTEPSTSSINFMVTSLIVTSVAAFLGFAVYGMLGSSVRPVPSGNEFAPPIAVITTLTPGEKVICKPGFVPPLCLARAFDKSSDLTYPGNGSARPAVAKDTIPGYDEIHRAAYVNDGMYGPGASWISNSPNSWIKIDLGKPTKVNTVTFGRDRLGQLNDRDPGQFVVSVALSDSVYEDGDSSNDNLEYQEVFNSEQEGFSGVVSGAETVTAQFDSLAVRYIKITFQNAGTAVDEVEAFMVEPRVPAADPTRTPKEPRPTATPFPTGTPIPTDTPLPTDTPTATSTPTDTPVPTDTPTPTPTDTPTPVPTDTPLPTDTSTPIPTDTPTPDATNSLLPTPTDLPVDPAVPIHVDSKD